MTPGRKDKKKKNKPETPESPTTPPSVTDDTKELLPAARGGTSSHQSRGKKKKKKSVTSEPSTQSSEMSVVDDDAQLPPSDATKDPPKAGTESPHTGPRNVSTESTRGKNRLAVPDQGAGGSRNPSSSPSKSPSPIRQFFESLVDKLSPKKSPKRSIGSESPNESTSRQNTEFPDPKQESQKESESNISEVNLREDGQNTGSSNSSGSSARANPDDAIQSENSLNVPGPKSAASSPRIPKTLGAKAKDKFFGERKKHEVHSEDSSSKSSSKSASSASVTSHNSEKRQESNASNTSENSRSSNSKSSSISCGDNKEHLHPEMMHSGDAVENTNNGSQLNVDKRDKKWRLLVGSNLLAVPPYLSTNRMDNLLVEGESRPRSRSDSSDVFLQQREISLSKDDSKTRQENSGDPETQMGTTAACSVHPVRNKSPKTGASEIGVDIQGATAADQGATAADQGATAADVRMKDRSKHRGANAPSSEGRSDQSVKKNTLAWSVNAPSGEGGFDQSVGTKNTATHIGANAPCGEGTLDQSVRKKKTGAWSVDGPSGVDDRSDKSVRSKDTKQRSGKDGKRVEKAKHSFLNSVTDLFAEMWQPRDRRLNQNDQSARPRSAVTRHRSLSPKCQHKFVHTPDCSATSRLNERRIRERRNQKKCKQPKHFNDNLDDIGNQRRAVRGNFSNLDEVRRNLPSLEKEMKLVISNLNLSRDEIVNSRSSLEEIDRYSSWLQGVRARFMRLQETLNEIIENSNFSGLDDIRHNIGIHDKNIDKCLRGINPDRLPGSNSRRLTEALENLAGLNMQLQEIRNNVNFSELESVSKELSEIHEEILKIQETVSLDSLLEVLHHLWHLWHLLQFILGR